MQSRNNCDGEIVGVHLIVRNADDLHVDGSEIVGVTPLVRNAETTPADRCLDCFVELVIRLLATRGLTGRKPET